MLSSWDDDPVHQVAETIRHVGTSDRNFYDRYCSFRSRSVWARNRLRPAAPAGAEATPSTPLGLRPRSALGLRPRST